MTVVFIILLAIGMVAGPILYLRPTARQNQQMRLRQKARELGMNVQLVSVPKPGEHHKVRVNSGGKPLGKLQVDCVRYDIPWPGGDMEAPGGGWRVERLALTTQLDQGDEFLAGRWMVDWRHAKLKPVVADFLREQVLQIPKSSVVVVADNAGLAVCWQEREEELAVPQIYQFLQQLQKIVVDAAA